MTNLAMPNNSCSFKYALKSVPGLADVGVPMGMAPELWPQDTGSKIRAYHVDQCEKPKRLDDSKAALRPNWPWGWGKQP